MVLLASLEQLERDVVHWITCTAHDETLGQVFRVVQSELVGIPLFFLGIAFVARHHHARARRAVLAAAAAFGLGMAVASLLWASAPRPRPPNAYDRVLRTETELASCASHPEAFALRDEVSHRPAFPSRHGITIGALVTALWLGRRRVGLVALAYGLFVAVGRVYVGRHWPSDLIAGMAIGAALAWVGWRLLPGLATRLGVPRLVA